MASFNQFLTLSLAVGQLNKKWTRPKRFLSFNQNVHEIKFLSLEFGSEAILPKFQ